jgi:TRAP-type transport system periplasmic protein
MLRSIKLPALRGNLDPVRRWAVCRIATRTSTCEDTPFRLPGSVLLPEGTMKQTALLAVAITVVSWSASAQEVTLKAVSAFAEKTTYARAFESFVERVNKDGKGVLQINYIGGPKAMPPFETGNALKTGVVDIANSTGAFYTNVMPEADTWKLTERPMAELRKNGGFDYMAKLYAEKMNAIFLARHVDNNPFHLYLNKPIKSGDLAGLKLRITPVYRDFFQAQGATVMQTAPGEVYTALERGVVDGYGWPITGIFDLGWHEKTKYRVDPGFYSAEVSILVNKTTWDKLNAAQKKVLSDAGAQTEAQAIAMFTEENAKDTKRQADAGIQVIKLEGAEGKAWLDKAYDAGWAGAIRQSAEHGPKLKEFFSKGR